MKFWQVLLVGLSLSVNSACVTNFKLVDFRAGMRMPSNESFNRPIPGHIKCLDPEGLFKSGEAVAQRGEQFERAYNTNLVRACANPSSVTRIPKIIHQIWVGQHPRPTNLNFAINSVKRLHPDWEYILWDNQKVAELDLEVKYGPEVVAQLNPGKWSDVVRLEVLARYGGVYLDLDFYACQPLDFLHENFDFYCGLVSDWFDVSNGVIGCTPKHPLIRQLRNNLRLDKNNSALGIMHNTGPYYVTNQIVQYYQTRAMDPYFVALPITYFFPMGGDWRSDFWDEKTFFDEIRRFACPESLTIHLFSTTWQIDTPLSRNYKLFEHLVHQRLIFLNDLGGLLDARRPSDGATPAIIATQRNIPQLIDLLGRHGANFDLRDNHGKTALDYAVEAGFVKIIDLIKSYQN